MCAELPCERSSLELRLRVCMHALKGCTRARAGHEPTPHNSKGMGQAIRQSAKLEHASEHQHMCWRPENRLSSHVQV